MEEDSAEKHLVRVNSVQEKKLEGLCVRLAFKIFYCSKYT